MFEFDCAAAFIKANEEYLKPAMTSDCGGHGNELSDAFLRSNKYRAKYNPRAIYHHPETGIPSPHIFDYTCTSNQPDAIISVADSLIHHKRNTSETEDLWLGKCYIQLAIRPSFQL